MKTFIENETECAAFGTCNSFRCPSASITVSAQQHRKWHKFRVKFADMLI